MNRIAAFSALAAACLFSIGVHAQTVYRCGADGRTYSQVPCAGGTTLNAGDTRSADERQTAQTVALADRALGDRLEQDRLQREAAPTARAGSLGGRTAAAKTATEYKLQTKPNDKKKRQRTQGKDKDFRAVSPNPKLGGKSSS